MWLLSDMLLILGLVVVGSLVDVETNSVVAGVASEIKEGEDEDDGWRWLALSSPSLGTGVVVDMMIFY